MGNNEKQQTNRLISMFSLSNCHNYFFGALGSDFNKTIKFFPVVSAVKAKEKAAGLLLDRNLSEFLLLKVYAPENQPSHHYQL